MSAPVPASPPAAASAASSVLATVQISGQHDNREAAKWREAIAAFLDLLWSGDDSLGACPSISFGSIVLFRASPEKGYRAYRASSGPWPAAKLDTDAWQTQRSSFLTAEVQNGLACLIFDDRIATLAIQLPSYGGRPSSVVFTKGSDPTQVAIEGINLPRDQDIAQSLV